MRLRLATCALVATGIGVVIGAPTLAETRSLESRVASALAAEVRSRMGEAAVVSVDAVVVSVGRADLASLIVVPSPTARLEQPVEFSVVAASSGGRTSRVGHGRADVRVSVPYAALSRPMARGAVLTSDDVMQVVGAPGAVLLRRLPTASELIGATLRRDSADARAITRQDVIAAMAVKAGDVVVARASVGHVQVTAELTALENGASGSIVRLVNRASRRELRARVLRPGVVEVLRD
jgi:flagella basal body P-ring formation protein FlgA